MAPLLSLLLTVDPCAKVAAAARTDPKLAGIYARVAKEEELQGASAAAAQAWARAAALEKPGGEAQRALARLCTEARAAGEFERAVTLFSERRCAEALPLLVAARAGPQGASAALLQGICLLEARDTRGATAALEVARQDPALADTAQLYLSLSSMESGSEDPRPRLRALAAGNSALRSTAAELLRLADSDRALTLDAELAGGFDSNASLNPFPTVLPGGADDGFAALLATLGARPWGAHGPYFSIGAGYRKYVRIPSADVGLATGTVGWQLDRARWRASLDYGVDFVALGAVPWLLRNRGTLRGELRAGFLTLAAEYALRHDLMLVDPVRDYTGLRHAVRVSGAAPVSRHLLELAGLFQHSGAPTPERAFVEAGAEVRAVFELRQSLVLQTAVAGRWRKFSALDPDLGVVREEGQLDVSTRADQDLTEQLALFLLLEGRLLATNAAGIGHTRLAATLGVRLAMGFW